MQLCRLSRTFFQLVLHFIYYFFSLFCLLLALQYLQGNHCTFLRLTLCQLLNFLVPHIDIKRLFRHLVTGVFLQVAMLLLQLVKVLLNLTLIHHLPLKFLLQLMTTRTQLLILIPQPTQHLISNRKLQLPIRLIQLTLMQCGLGFLEFFFQTFYIGFEAGNLDFTLYIFIFKDAHPHHQFGVVVD